MNPTMEFQQTPEQRNAILELIRELDKPESDKPIMWAFFKVKERWPAGITTENIEYIPEPDNRTGEETHKALENGMEVVGMDLCVKELPRTLKRMTARQAGEWAIRKCEQQGWVVNGPRLRMCLNNLEMDL